MTITYLHHSGFLITDQDIQILIDFYNPHHMDISDVIDSSKTLYVLASHQHADHFDPEIFTLEHPNKIYLLSSLTRPLITIPNEFTIHFMTKGASYTDNSLSLRCFGSTDEGESFFIQTANHSYFHGGDLNNWHWREDPETTPAESLAYEADFQNELDDIAASISSVEFVFFAVDFWLGKDYMLGPEMFITAIPTTYFIPMHMKEDFEKGNNFEAVAMRHETQFIPVHHTKEIIYKEED